MKILASILLLLSVGLVRADISPSAFDAANKLYEEGKFAEATAGYEKLLQSGHASEALYFNLGNAYFKSGQIGRAVAAYHQAERLSPRDPDVRANLKFARNQVQGPSLALAAWHNWLGKLSLNEWTCLAAASLWGFFLLLILAQWRPEWKPSLRGATLVMGLAAGVLGTCLTLVFHELHFARRAVVITREAAVRQGPLDESQTAFLVHDGAELEVLDQKEGWLQVSADPRRTGWVRRDQVLLSPNV